MWEVIYRHLDVVWPVVLVVMFAYLAGSEMKQRHRERETRTYDREYFRRLFGKDDYK